MKLCKREVFCCLQDTVSQKDDLSRGGGAKRGFGSRGRRRAPRRFGGWRGSRSAGPGGSYNRLVSVWLLLLSDIIDHF